MRGQTIPNHYRAENPSLLEDAISGSESRTGFQKRAKQICEIVSPIKVNPWDVVNQAIADHCRECWGGPGDCGAGSDCELYRVRAQRQREKWSADELTQTIRRECVRCLGSVQDICTSPKCALYPYRLGGKTPIHQTNLVNPEKTF
jgi:hypothetical protein